MANRLARVLGVKRVVGCIVALIAIALLAFGVCELYVRPMFSMEHEGHFGPSLSPLWEVVRPIRDHRGAIAFTDTDLNLMVLFLSHARDGTEPWPNTRSRLSAKFSLPSGVVIRIWRQRDKLLVVDTSDAVASIEIRNGTVRRVHEALFNMGRDKTLLEQLEPMLDELEAAHLRAVTSRP
jgi:hypothetical protein